MPDFFNHRTDPAAIDGMPPGWGEAFAALPVETPPGDGWTRLAHALDARRSRGGSARRERRTTWLIGIASAAVLVLAAWSPLSNWWQADVAQTRSPAVAQSAPGMRGPAAPVRAESVATTPAVDKSVETDIAKIAPATTSRDTASAASRDSAPISRRKSTRNARSIATRQSIEAAVVPSSRQPAPTESMQASTGDAVATTTTSCDPLQELQTQSAQLEALVALARDERVANASSELLSSEIDAGIAVVDAALSQADLDGTQKQELWQQRVDLLQQLAGVEATSRWLAAQGASSTTTLVAVD